MLLFALLHWALRWYPVNNWFLLSSHWTCEHKTHWLEPGYQGMCPLGSRIKNWSVSPVYNLLSWRYQWPRAEQRESVKILPASLPSLWSVCGWSLYTGLIRSQIIPQLWRQPNKPLSQKDWVFHLLPLHCTWGISQLSTLSPFVRVLWVPHM